MPQLVKGGKHAFGWSKVGSSGRIILPPEAIQEYCFQEGDKLYMIPGSQKSGGFALASGEALENSPLKTLFEKNSGLKEYRIPEADVIRLGSKPLCRVQFTKGSVTIPATTLKHYGIKIGDQLLVIRGSGLALGFALRGPIIEEALKHPELDVFAP